MTMVIFNALQTSLNGGIGRYSYEMAKNLYENNNEIEMKIVIREEDLQKFDFLNYEDIIIAKNIKNSKQRNIYEQFVLPRIIYKEYPKAIIHYPDSMAPLLAKNKVIITVHDLAFKSLKGAFKLNTTIWKNIVTNLSIRKATKIIAITNFTKNEIIKYYTDIDVNKISVIYNGFNNFSKEKIIEKNIRKDIKKIKKYILTVSTISPRKNIDGLILAFNEIKDEIEEDLVIAGANGWNYKYIFDLVKKLNLENRVIFTGKVNEDELKYLYKNANLFTYLSFYEGFGLPPLEAMSYGINCITSNTSCIPEVVGNNVIKVNPNNNKEIVEKILNGLSLKNNKNDYSENLKRFSWKDCSNNAKKIYNLI